MCKNLPIVPVVVIRYLLLLLLLFSLLNTSKMISSQFHLRAFRDMETAGSEKREI